MKTSISNAWESKLLAYVLLGVTAVITLFLLFLKKPSPGVAVAILGLVAALIAIRTLSPLEKFVWILVLAGLLFAEVRAIRIDQQSRTADFEAVKRAIQGVLTDEQAKFGATLEKINDTKLAIDKTLGEVNETKKQTQPHAAVKWISETSSPEPETEGPDPGPLYRAGLPYTFFLRFQNQGSANATNLKVLSRVYVAPLENAIAPRAAVKSFLDTWQQMHPKLQDSGDTDLFVPVSEGIVIHSMPATQGDITRRKPFQVSFNPEEILALRNKKAAVFAITRFEYTDETGTWREDHCLRFKPDNGMWNDCTIFTRTRYRIDSNDAKPPSGTTPASASK